MPSRTRKPKVEEIDTGMLDEPETPSARKTKETVEEPPSVAGKASDPNRVESFLTRRADGTRIRVRRDLDTGLRLSEETLEA